MNARKVIIGLAVAGMVWGSAGAVWGGEHGHIGHRQKKQCKRIYKGVRDGSITHREFVRLNKEQWRIEKVRKHAMRDSRISRSEGRRLQRMLNRASDHIRRAKHNHRHTKKHWKRHARHY